MGDSRAIEYIKQQRAFGVSDENIKTNAIRGGFTDQEIAEAFAALGTAQTSQVAFTPISQRVAPPGFSATPPIASTPPVQMASSIASPSTFVYAGFWRRFVAILLDGLLLSVVLITLSLIVAISLLGTSVTPTNTGPLVNVFAWMFAICTFFYYPLLESSSWQATIGKHLMGLRVTDINGARISFLRALARYLSKIVSSIFFIGYIMTAFTAKKQALHDFIAGTLVLKQAPARVGWIVGIFIVLMGVPLAIFAYAIYQYSHAQSNLADIARINDLREIEMALGLYQVNNAGTYPPKLGLLTSSNNLVGGQSVTVDPVTKAPYSYVVSSDGKSYVLCATLNSSPTISIPDASYSNGDYCVRSGPDAATMQTPTALQNATVQSQAGTGAISTNGSQTQPQNGADTGNRPLADMQVQGTASVAAVSVIAAPAYFTTAQPQVTDYHSLSDWQPVGPIQVVNEAWSAQISDLKGAYEIFLYDSSTYQLLATSTVTLSISPLWGPPSATIDASSLTTTSRTPIVTGTANHISELRVTVGDNSYDPTVQNGTWSTYSPATLAPGSYKVVVQDLATLKTLVIGTLVVQ